MSAGLEAFRDIIVDVLVEIAKPDGILARNDVALRGKEHLPVGTELLWGTVPQEIEINEHGIRMLAAPWQAVDDNVIMNTQMLEAFHHAKVKRVVFVSSATVYQPFQGAIRYFILLGDLPANRQVGYIAIGAGGNRPTSIGHYCALAERYDRNAVAREMSASTAAVTNTGCKASTKISR